MGEGTSIPPVLREATGPGTATVLIEANDRLQQIRSLLAAAVSPQQAHPARRTAERHTPPEAGSVPDRAPDRSLT